ncbi:glutamine synthetase, partial [bacterium]
MTPKEVLEFAKKNRVEIVDFKFVDVPGLWQHFSVPVAELTAELFEEGIGFDGSSI